MYFAEQALKSLEADRAAMSQKRDEVLDAFSVGFTALAANAASFALLWSHRGGDANMRSAWICTRK